MAMTDTEWAELNAGMSLGEDSSIPVDPTRGGGFNAPLEQGIFSFGRQTDYSNVDLLTDDFGESYSAPAITPFSGDGYDPFTGKSLAPTLGERFTGLFKGETIRDPQTGKLMSVKSPFEKSLPLLKFGLGFKQMQDQMQLMEDMQRETKLQNKRSVLGTIETANRKLGNTEYNRLRMQGLSDEQARKKSDAYVADRGLTPEQFGLKPFSQPKKRNSLTGQSPLRDEFKKSDRIITPYRL